MKALIADSGVCPASANQPELISIVAVETETSRHGAD
jgi:hypothetical protein